MKDILKNQEDILKITEDHQAEGITQGVITRETNIKYFFFYSFLNVNLINIEA